MDVLYVVGSGSMHNNEELRYSLRSLAKMAKNIGKVYIVGECPSFIDRDKVTHIPCADMYNRKCKNIWKKVLMAIENSDIGNEFLMSSDDIFHIKEQDLDNYPYYWKNGAQVSVPASMRNTSMWAIIQECRKLLTKYNYPLWDYGGGHCLHHMDKSILLNMPKITREAFAGKYGAPIDVMMGNAIVKLKNPQVVKRKDIKLVAVKDEEDFYRQIGEAKEFSINDKAWDDFVGNWLAKRFPEKCVYEK